MPACIARIVGGRKPDGERPEVPARTPATRPDKLVERLVEVPRIGGPREGFSAIVAEPDHGLGPCRRVVRIAAGIPPQDGAARVRITAREGLLDLDEPVPNELADLCIRSMGARRQYEARW